MRARAMVFMLGALLVGVLQVGGAPPALAGSQPRHDGVVEAVDLQARSLTVSELAEGGTMRTLTLPVSPDATIVRSRPLPADQVTDLERPLTDTAIDLADVRPGDFVVVQLSGSPKKVVVSSIIVTFESGSTPSQPVQAAAR